MVYIHGSAGEKIPTQGSMIFRRVRRLSSSDNLDFDFTSVSKLIRPRYKEGILFPDPLV